jgi:hypothetical protein
MTGLPRENEMRELDAALGARFAEPDVELLGIVEDALAKFPVPDDWYPDAAVAG